MNEILNTRLVCAHKKNSNFYLINVSTVGTISTETCWAWATLPGSIWRAVAIHSPKAWVRQTAICKRFRWQEWIQAREIDLNIAGYDLHGVSPIDSTWVCNGWDILPYQNTEGHILSCCMKSCIKFWFAKVFLFFLPFFASLSIKYTTFTQAETR